MKGDAGYALQKLELSVNDLAIGSGNIKGRLTAIFREHLHVLREDDFPDNLRDDWIRIKNKITSKGPLFDNDGKVAIGSLDRTLKGMRMHTASDIASMILLLSEKLRAQLEEASSLSEQ